MLFKGASFLTTIVYLKKNFGEDIFQKILNQLNEEDKDRYLSAISPSKWYSLKSEINIWAVITRELFEGDESWLIDRGRFAADRDLGGVYRMFIKMGSPEHLIGKVAFVTNSYFQGIEGVAKVLAPNKVTVRYKGFAKEYRLIELVVLGWILKALELSGVKDPKGEITTSLLEDKGSLEYLFTWAEETNPSLSK